VKKSNSVRLFLQPQEVLKPIGESQVTIGIKVGGGLLGFGATVVVWVDSEGLLPTTTTPLINSTNKTKTPQNTMFMITKAVESAL
jgi:hypothetical protein